VKEVKSLNGSVSFKNVLRYQKDRWYNWQDLF
jgi:hypothetical protein